MSSFTILGVLYTVPAESGHGNASGIEVYWCVTSLSGSGLNKAAGGDEEGEGESVYG